MELLFWLGCQTNVILSSNGSRPVCISYALISKRILPVGPVRTALSGEFDVEAR